MGDLRVAAGFEARVERHGQAVAADRAVDDPALVGRDVNGVVEQQALARKSSVKSCCEFLLL